MFDGKILNQPEVLIVCQAAICRFGPNHQIKKAAEEMSELITELMREQDNRTSREKVAEEIADVLITLVQMAYFFKCGADVNYQILYKIERLKGEMKGGPQCQ